MPETVSSLCKKNSSVPMPGIEPTLLRRPALNLPTLYVLTGPDVRRTGLAYMSGCGSDCS